MLFSQALSQLTSQAIPPWNSLEISKIIVNALTPILVIVFGFWLNRRLKHLELIQWANQKIIEKRIKIYEEITPLLNELLCYFTYIGSWKEMTPPEIVNLKRKIDKIAYINAPLLPSKFLEHYNYFMQLCYETYSGWGQDAQLKTKFKRRCETAGNQW
ncbi:MAG: hypothetical protein JXB10_02925 [Pirellulales bacterium]|nr:hypothetical protein [Pirellulales bacterium]